MISEKMQNALQIPYKLGGIINQPVVVNGLDTFYSPNHAGQRTREHILKQSGIVDSIALIASLFNRITVKSEFENEMSTIEFVKNWNYQKLGAIVDNEKVRDNKFLYTTADDLEKFFTPLLDGLSDSDLEVLVAAVGTHDLGKVDVDWARRNLDIRDVEFIAHEYDSWLLLRNNPGLLDVYNLEESQIPLTLDLVRLHSLPGQYFFGEGNISGYQPILDCARDVGSENPLKIARIHGLIDVISALNNRFVKPILNSHIKLSQILSDVYNSDLSLGQAFMKEADQETSNLSQIKEDYSLSSISLYRLMKLTGLKEDNSGIINDALNDLDSSFVNEFERTTKGEITWFGTYIANAFGSGLSRGFGKEPTNNDLKTIVGTTVKMVAAGSKYHSSFRDTSYALSSVTPGLMVVDGDKDGFLGEVNGYMTLDEAVKGMTNKSEGLFIRGNQHAIELGHKIY